MKNYLITALVSLLIGVGITYYALPPKIQTKIEEVTKEVTKKDVVVVTERIIQKDGTVIEKTRTEDKSISTANTDKKSESKVVDKQWRIGVKAIKKSLTDPGINYGLSVERKILGPFNLGGYVTTDKQMGVSISIDL
jgi:hypothetical protein